MRTPDVEHAPDDAAARAEASGRASSEHGRPNGIGRTATWADLTVVATVMAVGALTYVFIVGGPAGPPLSAGLAPGTVRRLMALPPRQAMPAALDLAGGLSGETPVRAEGSAVGLSFRLETRGRPLVLEERAQRETVVLFPPPGQPSVPVPAGRRIEVTDPGGGTLVVRDPPGPRRVRLVVFPPDVDPSSVQPTELARLELRLTILERRYVAGFREGPDDR